MSNENPPVEIGYTDEFRTDAEYLKRRHRHFDSDLKPLIAQLQQGETPGDRVQKVAPYIVYKARLKNTDARRGKSGGYRLIYYVKTADRVILLTVYSKSDKADIAPKQIQQIIESFES